MKSKSIQKGTSYNERIKRKSKKLNLKKKDLKNAGKVAPMIAPKKLKNKDKKKLSKSMWEST